MKRVPYLENPVKLQSRDTKNIVKNIVKLFMNWLSNNAELESHKATEEMNNMLFEIKYNNRLITAMVESDNVKGPLRIFLEKEAPPLIISSKINDK